MRIQYVINLAAALLTMPVSYAADVRVLSAGAVEPGIRAAIALFEKETGDRVTIRFATAPALRKLVMADERADILVAPPAVLEDMVRAGKAGAGLVPLGRVGVGVAVRNGLPLPEIATTDALKKAMLAADQVIYNQASTGNYVSGLLERLGLADQIGAKTKRYPDGDAVMDHIVKGAGNELGFGAMTEIKLYVGKGLQFAGPLPADIQNYTQYAAVQLQSSTDEASGAKFLKFLGSAQAKAALIAEGVD